MAHDPIRTLKVLRRMAVDAARQELFKCEQYEQALDSHVQACAEAIAASEPGATDGIGPGASLSALHGYLDKMERRAALLRQHVPPAQARTDMARNGLAQARLAEKAVLNVSEKREQEASARNLRRAQHELDDISRRSRYLMSADRSVPS